MLDDMPKTKAEIDRIRNKFLGTVPVDPVKGIQLPKPKHELGYTEVELKNILFKAFCKDQYGATCSQNENGDIIFYTQDVMGFLERIRGMSSVEWD